MPVAVAVLAVGAALSMTRPTVAADSAGATPATSASVPQVTAYGRLPLSFEANHGQSAPGVKFVARGPLYTLELTGAAATLTFNRDSATAVVRLSVVAGSTLVPPKGLDLLPGKANYYVGRDPADWKSEIPAYGKVLYPEVYPGITSATRGQEPPRTRVSARMTRRCDAPAGRSRSVSTFRNSPPVPIMSETTCPWRLA